MNDVLELPRSLFYQELREIFACRLPRVTDIKNYIGNGWQMMFGPFSWLLVGAPLRSVTPQAGLAELQGLPDVLKEPVHAYLKMLQNNAGNNDPQQQLLPGPVIG